MYYVGIDPGKTGGFAILNEEADFISSSIFVSFTEFFKEVQTLGEYFQNGTFAVLEQVSAMPGQGVSSMFTFGQNYGGWQATLEILKIRYELVTPQKWQKAIIGSIPKGESKPRALAFAQRRFPNLNLKKKDHGIVDALLMALYARQLHLGEANNGRANNHVRGNDEILRTSSTSVQVARR